MRVGTSSNDTASANGGMIATARPISVDSAAAAFATRLTSTPPTALT